MTASLKGSNLSIEIQKISSTLRRFNHLFEENLFKLDPDCSRLSQQDPEGYYHISYWWPVETGRDSTVGLTLKHHLGKVSIEVEYSSKNKREFSEIKHTFRFTNTDHIYMAIYYENGVPKDTFEKNYYMFRYDKLIQGANRKKDEPIEHIQVLHGLPQFPYRPVVTPDPLTDFLEVIEATCWSKDKVSGEQKPNQAALFST